MAYRLLNESIKSEQSVEKLRENRISIFGFMAFSTFVMAGALFITIKQKPEDAIKVNVAFLPNEPKALGMMDFSIAGLPQEVPTEGVLSGVELKNDRAITFNLSRMNQRMTGLEGDMDSLRANVKSLLADKEGLQSQVNLFAKEKADAVLLNQEITLTRETIEEESGI
jgi:hypothetical protein